MKHATNARQLMAVLSCLIAVWTASAPAQAEPATLEEAFEAIAARAGAIESWKAGLDIQAQMMGMQMNYTGAMQGKGSRMAGNIRMNLMGQTIDTKIAGDSEKVIWSETGVMGQTIVVKMDTEAMRRQEAEAGGLAPEASGGPGAPSMLYQDPRAFLESYRERTDLKYLGADTLGETEVYVFEAAVSEEMRQGMDAQGQMRAAGMAPHHIRISIGALDGFPRKFEMLQEDRQPFMTLGYNDVELNVPIDDSVFEYTPPDNAMVIDAAQGLPGMQRPGQAPVSPQEGPDEAPREE